MAQWSVVWNGQGSRGLGDPGSRERWGVVDDVEFPGGCPWRCGGRDGEPWRSLLEEFTACK